MVPAYFRLIETETLVCRTKWHFRSSIRALQTLRSPGWRLCLSKGRQFESWNRGPSPHFRRWRNEVGGIEKKAIMEHRTDLKRHDFAVHKGHLRFRTSSNWLCQSFVGSESTSNPSIPREIKGVSTCSGLLGIAGCCLLVVFGTLGAIAHEAISRVCPMRSEVRNCADL
jgi:hypothetical protein